MGSLKEGFDNNTYEVPIAVAEAVEYRNIGEGNGLGGVAPVQMRRNRCLLVYCSSADRKKGNDLLMCGERLALSVDHFTYRDSDKPARGEYTRMCVPQHSSLQSRGNGKN